ncbi:hypothetical protein MRY16398_p10600 (plasmid) [Phytobacter sp. MRY16-398]|nr:hypothetical protein MRY16398_p10600 [Phytobacter sp. MRY16-398]
MAVVFAGVSESESEYRAALEYLQPCGVPVIPGAIPFLTSFSQGSSQKTESMVTPVFATPILTISWLA